MSYTKKDLHTSNNPKIQSKIDRTLRHDRRVEHVLRRCLHLLERAISIITIFVLGAALVVEIFQMFTVSGYVSDVESYLHHILTIVVGIEFVRMIIDITPANILEVLTLAITRHVILSHDDPWSNVACIACIAGLFATRRFLVPHNELKEEMVEME